MKRQLGIPALQHMNYYACNTLNNLAKFIASPDLTTTPPRALLEWSS